MDPLANKATSQRNVSADCISDDIKGTVDIFRHDDDSAGTVVALETEAL